MQFITPHPIPNQAPTEANMSALLKTLHLLRVAVIDDPLHQIGQRTEQLTQQVRHANFEARWELIPSEAALAAKMSSALDLILTPYQASPLDASRVLQIVRESGAAIPVIVIDNAIGETAVVTVMRQGAADFVRWDQLERFADAVSGSQQRLSSQRLLESVGDISYVYQVAPMAKLIYVSPAIQAITGYPTQTFYRDPDLLQRFLPVKQIEVLAQANAAASSHVRSAFQPAIVPFRRPSADLIYLEHQVIPLADQSGQLLLHGIARDMTSREKANQALSRQTGYMVALQETALTVMDNHDHYQLLEAILVQARRLTGTEHGCVYLMEPGETALTMRITSGFFDQFAGHQMTSDDHQLAMQQYNQSGQHVTVSNFSIWPRRDTNPELDLVQAVISVPLKVDDDIVGVLSLVYLEPGRSFGNAEIALLGHFAALTSVALKNSRLVGDAHRELVERRRIEQLLKEREERLQFVLEGSNDGFWDWDVQTGKMEVSARWAEMLGYAPAEVEPNIQFWEKLLHPDDSAAVRQNLSEHLAGRSANYEAETRMLTRTGEWKWILTRGKVAASDAEGKPRRMAGTHTDISENKKAQQNEKSVVSNLRGVLEMADELISTQDINLFYRRAVELPREKLGIERCAIFLLDPTRQFLAGTYGTDDQGAITDERQVKFSSQRNPELLSRFDGPWWVTQNGVLTAWDGNKIKDVGAGWIATTLIRFGDEPIGIFSNDAALTGAPLNAIQQESISLYCSLLGHIIERKRNEETLRESLQHQQELSELRARFVTTVSHEFRTPLATILATADSLRHYLPKMNDVQKTERFDKIETQVRHMIALLNDVLIVGEIEEGTAEVHREWCDLNHLFREMAEDFNQANTGYALDYVGTMEPAAIMADRKLIRQMVTNLLTNAAKYSPVGSTITFTLTHDPQRVVFSIKDQGIGIPEADLPNLFAAFRRGTNVGNISGTGLGLSIVKHAVDAHCGTIKVDSVLTVGTTFTITLPIDSVN